MIQQAAEVRATSNFVRQGWLSWIFEFERNDIANALMGSAEVVMSLDFLYNGMKLALSNKDEIIQCLSCFSYESFRIPIAPWRSLWGFNHLDVFGFDDGIKGQKR